MNTGPDDDMQALHDLRNAVNTACLTLDVAIRLIECNQAEKARIHIENAKAACDKCRPLLQNARILR